MTENIDFRILHGMIVFSTLYLLEVHSPRSFAKNHVVQVDLFIKIKEVCAKYIPNTVIYWVLVTKICLLGVLKQVQDLDQNAGWI